MINQAECSIPKRGTGLRSGKGQRIEGEQLPVGKGVENETAVGMTGVAL